MDPNVQKAALIRLVRVLAAAVLAVLGTWLVGPGPGDVFGTQVAVFIVPVATALISALDKAYFGTVGPVIKGRGRHARKARKV